MAKVRANKRSQLRAEERKRANARLRKFKPEVARSRQKNLDRVAGKRMGL